MQVGSPFTGNGCFKSFLLLFTFFMLYGEEFLYRRVVQELIDASMKKEHLRDSLNCV